MPKAVIPVKALVFEVVPSSTKEKLVSGVGEPVKANDVEPSVVACFTTVMDPGSTTAVLLIERSMLPTLQLVTFPHPKLCNRM